MTAEWFPGEGRDPDDEAFLAELRRLAAAEGLVDARPEDTRALVHERSGAVVCVRVPRLGRADAQLQVGVDRTGPDGPALAVAWESWGFVLDLAEPLDGDGEETTPQAMARRAFAWLDAQLRRPVEERTWVRRLGRSSWEWRLSDTDQLVTNGGMWLPPRRRPPSAVTRLR